MPGTRAGTGQPNWFVCQAARNARVWPDPYPDGHDKVVRTGRTRNRKRGAGVRTLLYAHEYVCECGHVGWSRHVDILSFPIAWQANNKLHAMKPEGKTVCGTIHTTADVGRPVGGEWNTAKPPEYPDEAMLDRRLPPCGRCAVGAPIRAHE